ncbi:hypothetical protein ACF09J_31090 [Streptomyces sp. NPDC014889]|uniref:hypothetical protein n=1 Tax=Streptomyces sp. NPDC014889 TaxID=3364928 RepID=UPI003701F20B
MHKSAVGKRLAAAFATASLAGALGLAGSGSAQAASATAAPEPLSFTIDYSKTSIPQVPTLGAGFAGNGPVYDASGNQIGKVYDACTVDGVESVTTVHALCHAYVIFSNGDELDLSTQAKIELNPLKYPYTIKAVVQGGTGAYSGAQGEAAVTAQKPGVYKVDVQFK